MVAFSDHAANLSAEVDNRLGDLILYAINGAEGGAYVSLRGRIFSAEPAAGWEKNDEMKGGWRLRIAKVLVPTPSKDDRLQCAEVLGETAIYRPIARDPIDDGRYWLIDIQKV